MNIVNLFLIPIMLSISLNTYAQVMADETDLKTFSEKNYCQGCDISNAEINEDHDNGALLNSFAIKTEFKGSFHKMDFSGSIMTYCKVYSWIKTISAQEANFNKVNLSYAHIEQTDLSGSQFTDVNLSNTDFYNVNLSDVDFTNANLQDVTIKNSILIGANLSDDQMEQIKSIRCSIMPNGEMNTKDC